MTDYSELIEFLTDEIEAIGHICPNGSGATREAMKEAIDALEALQTELNIKTAVIAQNGTKIETLEQRITELEAALGEWQINKLADLQKEIKRLDAALGEIENNTYSNSTELKAIARIARTGDD